jgi:hypothetical protein
MKAKLILSSIALFATFYLVSAQGNCCAKAKCNKDCKGSGYVDTNKNGVCDNYENRSDTTSVNKGNCNGTGQGKVKCKGKNFVDNNKNGVCDNYEARNKK